MKAQTPCQTFEAHLTPYLLGDLAPAQAAAVKAHVEQCPACQATLRELSATVDLLQNAFAAETAAPPLCLTPERRATVVRQARRKPRPAGVWALLTHPSAKIALKAAAVVALLLAIVAVLVPQMARNARMYEVVGTGAGEFPRPSVTGLLHGWFGGNGGAKLAYHLDRGAPAASVDASEVVIHEAAMPADAFEDHGVAATPARSEGKSAGAYHYRRSGAVGGGSGSGVAATPPPAPPIPVLSRRPGMPPPESAPGSAGTALAVQDEAQTSDGAFGPSGPAGREKGKASGALAAFRRDNENRQKVIENELTPASGQGFEAQAKGDGLAKKLEYFDYESTTKHVQKAPVAASDDWSGRRADERSAPVAKHRTLRPVDGTERMSENIVRDPWAPGRDALNKAAARGARLSGKGDLSKAANEESATELASRLLPAEAKPAADAAAVDDVADVLSLGGDGGGKAKLGLKRDRGVGNGSGAITNGTTITSGDAVTVKDFNGRLASEVTAAPVGASERADAPRAGLVSTGELQLGDATGSKRKAAKSDEAADGPVAVGLAGAPQQPVPESTVTVTPVLGRLFKNPRKAVAVPLPQGKTAQIATGGGVSVAGKEALPADTNSDVRELAGNRQLRENAGGDRENEQVADERVAEVRWKWNDTAATAKPRPVNAPPSAVTQTIVTDTEAAPAAPEPAPEARDQDGDKLARSEKQLQAVAATTTPAAPSATPVNAVDAGVQATSQKLAKVVVDKIHVEEKTVRQVVEDLNRKIAAAGGKPVEIVFESDKREADEKAGAAAGKEAMDRTVTMSMQNIPAGEVLRYVCLGAGLKSRVENGRVVITEKYQAMEDVAKPAVEPTPPAEPLGGPVFAPPTFNAFVDSAANAFSTFSIAVDTAAYTLARRYILQGQRPSPGGVKVEDFINSFEYEYAPPAKNAFAIYADVVPSPFRRSLDVLKVGIKGYRIGRDRERQAILTVLIDTSGSMNTPDRLELARQALHLLIEHMNPNDQVALVQFDSKARLVLPHTAVADKARLLAAVDTLQTGGSTNLDAGIRLAYEVAAGGFRPTGSNRVILFSDGMANLGTASAATILKDVENYRKQGIYCSIFGVGTGNYNDVMLGALAEKGDGVYKFIDSLAEAKRVLVDDISATLHVIAKDVKIQVQFNPDRVARYRQLGYENRQLTKEQFRDDTVDAGEVGSGQAVTALYELAPGARPDAPVGVVRVRYRDVETGKIVEIEKNITVNDRTADVAKAPARVRLALGVAELAELLRGSPNVVGSDFNEVLTVLRPVAQELRLDAGIQELVRLVQAARRLPAAE